MCVTLSARHAYVRVVNDGEDFFIWDVIQVPSSQLGTAKTAGLFFGWLVGWSVSRVCLSAQRRRGASRAINIYRRAAPAALRGPAMSWDPARTHPRVI